VKSSFESTACVGENFNEITNSRM